MDQGGDQEARSVQGEGEAVRTEHTSSCTARSEKGQQGKHEDEAAGGTCFDTFKNAAEAEKEEVMARRRRRRVIVPYGIELHVTGVKK
jgi:hypothetical protein